MEELERVARRLAESGMDLQEILSALKSIKGVELSEQEKRLVEFTVSRVVVKQLPQYELKTSVCNSIRAGMFRLKRLFWMSVTKDPDLDKDISKHYWRKLMEKLIPAANNIPPDVPVRILVKYVKDRAGPRLYFRPINAQIQLYQMLDTVNVELEEVPGS